MSNPAERPEQPPADYNPDLCWPPRYVVAWKSDGHLGGLQCFATEHEAEEQLRYGDRRWRSDLHVRPATWREREYTKNYTMPVWHEQKWWQDNRAIWADHFVHQSSADRGLLAYTQDARKGQRDVQTPIKPGRYLAKYFAKILSEREIAFYARWQATGVCETSYSDGEKFPLSFAHTPDEIEDVYVRGPDSCMAGGADDYASSEHPTRVYGAGDLAIAHLSNPEAKPIARCLTWPARKVAGRLYPSVGNWRTDGFTSAEDAQAAQDALRDRLIADGYEFLATKPSGFDGARLLRIEEDDNHVAMPYLDNGYCFDDAGDHLVMRRAGAFSATDTNGLARIEPEHYGTCERCEDTIETEDDAHVVHTRTMHSGGRLYARGPQTWCEHCAAEHAFYCEGLNENFSDEDVGCVILADGTAVCEDWAEDHCFSSDLSGKWFRRDDVASVELHDGDVWTADEFAEHGFTCAITGELYSKEEAHRDHPTVYRDCTDEEIADWLATHAPPQPTIRDPRQLELAA